MICVTGAMLVFREIVRAVQRRHDSLLTFIIKGSDELIRTVGKDLRVLILDWHLCLTMLMPALYWTHEATCGSSIYRLLLDFTIVYW